MDGAKSRQSENIQISMIHCKIKGCCQTVVVLSMCLKGTIDEIIKDGEKGDCNKISKIDKCLL